MNTLEPKKLALIRILQILETYSDFNHRLTQENIADYLDKDYGIIIERKAISRNLSLLKESGYDIETKSNGSYLNSRQFEDSELRMLIDGVLCSKYITPNHSSDLINRLCQLSNIYFRSHVRNVYSVDEWDKTDNQSIFYNIEIIDMAIEQGKQVKFDYNKYGVDKKLHKSSSQIVSPYQLILHNQRYYLMAFSEYWKSIVYLRLDHITNITIAENSSTPIDSVEGYKGGINYKNISSAMPYMYADKPERVVFTADSAIVDQICDWFGSTADIIIIDKISVSVTVKVSLKAMEHWAMQYINHVEIMEPDILRKNIRENLDNALKKY